MRGKILATAAVTALLVGAAVVITSCQDGTTAPTPEHNPNMDAAHVIVEGDVYDWNGDLLPGATVTWECYTCGALCGTTETGPDGHYRIERDDTFSEHEGHDLRGEVYHPAAPTAPPPAEWIYDYDPERIPYWRDFWY